MIEPGKWLITIFLLCYFQRWYERTSGASSGVSYTFCWPVIAQTQNTDSFSFWINLHVFLSSADFSKSTFFEHLCQEYHQSVKKFGSEPGLMFCPAWSGSNPVCKCYQQTPHKDSANLDICLLFVFVWFDYVHSTIFQLCGTGLPGLNQY